MGYKILVHKVTGNIHMGAIYQGTKVLRSFGLVEFPIEKRPLRDNKRGRKSSLIQFACELRLMAFPG